MMNKKIIRIAGTATQPIEVGQSAVIAESNGSIRRTSMVVNVENVSGSEVKFETQNSIYYLKLKKQEPLAGAILRKMFEMRDNRC